MKTNGTKLVISVIAFVVVVGGIFAFVAGSVNKGSLVQAKSVPSTSPVSSPATNLASDNPADTSTAKNTKYKDGTYTATGNYNSPAGYESINVSITLKNSIVTGSSVTAGAYGGRSARYQQMFIGGYKAYVIGKNIDTISLSRVSGSSLTPAGFNDALSQIKSQAQA